MHVVSLGCAKNRIDTEHMLGVLSGTNAVIVDEPDDADVIIVNTCGFINDAKQESIDTILEMARYKDAGCARADCDGLPCAAFTPKELAVELPEVDAFLGVAAYSRLPDAIRAALESERFVCCERLDEDLTGRVLTTPAHLAYVRIADGCSNDCSYCAIPAIRGPQKSRSMKSVLAELSDLRRGGVSEAVLIAQDTTRYGEDLGRRQLAESDRQGGGHHAGRLAALAVLLSGGYHGRYDRRNASPWKCLPVYGYAGAAFQRRRGLRRMNRRHTRASTQALVRRLHEAGFTLRTSLIVGFPGETQDDFETLLKSVSDLRFERLGVFRYSVEEGTSAAQLPGQIPEEVKMAAV